MESIFKFILASYIPSAICVFLYTYSSYRLDLELNDEKMYRRNEAGELTWMDHVFFYGHILIPAWNLVMALLIIGVEASDCFAGWLEKYLERRAYRKMVEETKDEFVP